MTKVIKWLVGLALALLALFAAAAFALHLWVGTDDFRQRMAREATAALGVPVTLGAVVVAVWPLPALALKDIEIQSKPPLALGRVEVRPEWQSLLQGRLVVTTLIVRQAVLPQQGIDALLLARQKKPPVVAATAPAASQAKAAQAPAGTPPPAPAPMAWLPRRTLLDQVTWISAVGASTTFNAEARLGADGLPDSASLSLTRGHLQGLQAALARKEPAAAVDAQAGNGLCALMWAAARWRASSACSSRLPGMATRWWRKASCKRMM